MVVVGLLLWGVDRIDLQELVESSLSSKVPAVGGDNDDNKDDDDGKIEPPAITAAAPVASSSMIPGVASWIRSWRPCLLPSPSGRASLSGYLDLTKPGLRLRNCTVCAQRPNLENMRSRSRLFRSR